MAKNTKDHESTAKLTPQREAVLQVIRAREDHPTANEIFEAARAILPAISYATVYNSLRYLRETGLVHEINFGDSASRYDGITERHDHAICTNCGKLVDFDLQRGRRSHAGRSTQITLQARESLSDADGSLS